MQVPEQPSVRVPCLPNRLEGFNLFQLGRHPPAPSFYGVGFVLVLSIAVLVLVLDPIFGYRFCWLNLPSEHRDDSLQVRFFAKVGFLVHGVTNRQDIMNRSTLQGRTASYLKEPIFVFKALLAVSFCDIQRNGLRSTQPLLASRSIVTG